MKTAAVIVAAGKPKKEDDFEPLMCVSDNTMIGAVICCFKEAGINDIFVVTGYHAAAMEKYLKQYQVNICENSDYAKSEMYEPILIGLRNVQGKYDRVFISPADIPLISFKTIELLNQNSGEIVRPVYQGMAGHPILISDRFIPMLLEYHGNDGLKGALSGLHQSMTNIETEDSGVIEEAGSKYNFRSISEKMFRKKYHDILMPEVNVSLMKNGTVMTPEVSLFLKMIDLTGSIQSACLSVHISYTSGWEMINKIEDSLGYPLITRSHGGHRGGGSCLTEKGKIFLSKYNAYIDEVTETAKKIFNKMDFR